MEKHILFTLLCGNNNVIIIWLLLIVFSLSRLALHVYDSRDVVHALGHGRTVLFSTVVHVQQSGQRQYVSAGYADRRQFGQLLVP